MGIYPTNVNEVNFLDCWTSRENYPYHSTDWFHSPTNFRMQEDIDADGTFEDIYGIDASNGYIGVVPTEGVFQKLNQSLIKDQFYGLKLYVRVPDKLHRFIPDIFSSVNPAVGLLELELTFSKNALDYVHEDANCHSNGNDGYKLEGEGVHGKQVITHPIDFSQKESGIWYEILIPPFIAKKNWTHLALQTKIDGERIEECAQYILFDGVQIFGDCDLSECETCSYVDGDIQMTSCNQINNGTQPLEFYGVSNVSSAAVTVTSTNGSLIHTENFNCPGGWINDTLQINLNQYGLAVQYYYASVLFTNDCNACLKTFSFLYQDYYTQGFEPCTCRTENLIRPCCINEVELEEPGITCSTPPTLNYEIIDDLLVGVSNDFEVPANVHLNLIAGNSIHFGPKFKSGQGTFRAEIIPCSSNKRLQGESAFKNADELKNSNYSNELFKVFPNLTQDQFVVQNLTDLPGKLKIIDMEGRLVETFEISNNSSEIIQPQFSNGVYFVQFQNEYGQYTEKLVISSP